MNDKNATVLTTAGAARLLGVATSTVQAWIEQGSIPSWKTPGGHRRVRLVDVQSMMPGNQPAFATSSKHATVLAAPTEFQPAVALGYPVCRDEATRLLALAASRLVDTPCEDRFDRLVRLASLATGSPVALVSLLTSTRQWFKARIGLDLEETPREWAFCSHTICGGGLFMVEDAAMDPRFSNNPLVRGEVQVRFYAGVPVRDSEGHALGTLCIIDHEPRKLRAVEMQALTDLAAIVSEELQRAQGNRNDTGSAPS